MPKVFLDDMEVNPAELNLPFYTIRRACHSMPLVPRQPREKVLEIIEKADEDIYLSPADFPFIDIYKKFRNS